MSTIERIPLGNSGFYLNRLENGNYTLHWPDGERFNGAHVLSPDEAQAFAAALQPQGWQPMDSAPIPSEATFYVRVKNDLGEWVCLQVNAFQGDMFPAYKGGSIDYTDRITDAQGWSYTPLPPAPVEGR